MTRRHSLSLHGLLAHVGLALVLLLAQHGALRHVYSHFGVVPDPYATGDTHAPPAQGCDLGIVHATLDCDPPSAFALLPVRFGFPAPLSVFVTAFTPLSLHWFHSRAPPAQA